MIPWNFESPNTKKHFSANLKKAKRNHDAELKKARNNFSKKYPFAKLSEFEFWVDFEGPNGVIENVKIVYKGDVTKRLYNEFGTRWGNWPVTSRVFKTLYSGALYWGPSKIWSPTTTTESFELGKGVFPFRLCHFEIFVNGDQSFTFITEPLNTKWSNS